MSAETTENTETKRQHYVPRFLLRKFSRDEKRIDAFILAKDRYIPNVGLKEQCAESFFYGEDGSLERAFATMEGSVSCTVAKLLAGDFAAVSKEEVLGLRLFIFYQLHRTRGAADQVSDSTSATVKKIVETHLKAKGQWTNQMDSVRIVHKKPQFLALNAAMKLTPLTMDLHIKFLVHDRKRGLITSDHPVVLYNRFAEQHPILSSCTGTHGLALKGLQVFLPITPWFCIALFDSSTYAYGNPQSLIGRMGSRDILWLNRLQAVNASKCIYSYSSQYSEPELKEYRAFRQLHASSKHPRTIESPEYDRGDGTMGKVLQTIMPDTRLGAGFSFAQITDRHHYQEHHSPLLPLRSPELVSATKEYGQFLDQQIKKAETNENSTD